MQPERIGSYEGPRAIGEGGISAHWRLPLLALGAGWLTLFIVFASDWAAMARQWWDISTYNHMLLIPPVECWLLWNRRHELARIEPRAWWAGLPRFAAAGLVWLLGGVSGFDLLRQAGVVGMLAMLVPLLLGPRVTAGVLFPLFYLAFLIPFGEELVKPLQMVTAKIAIALTHLSGVPAEIDGVFIDTPAGLFKVAEACSGVKFLIAMIAFGVLAANVCFLSWRRRAALLAACLVVPIVANGIRAWATIYAAQFFGVAVAAGFDHIVYGWVFFALVLFAVLGVAWKFFDRPVDASMISLDALHRSRLLALLERGAAASRGQLAAVVGAAFALVAALQLWLALANALEAPLPTHVGLPQVPGWFRVASAAQVPWQPRAGGADHRLQARYVDGQGHKVDVVFALYARQGEGYEAGGFGQGALVPDSVWSWHSAVPAFEEGRGERLLANDRSERVAMTWYRHGDLLSGSNLRLKLAVIARRMRLKAQPTAMLILSAPEGGGEDAIATLNAFHQSIGPLDRWMDARVAGR